MFQLSAADNAISRASTEAAIAASVVMFIYIFLQLRRWHTSLAAVFGVWVLAQLFLIGFALIDSKLASGLARLSYVPIAVMGSLLMTVLALRGQERALSLLPTWMLFLVWLFGAAVAIRPSFRRCDRARTACRDCRRRDIELPVSVCVHTGEQFMRRFGEFQWRRAIEHPALRPGVECAARRMFTGRMSKAAYRNPGVRCVAG